MNLRERIKRLKRYNNSKDGMKEDRDGQMIYYHQVVDIINQHEAEQTKPEFAEFGGFNPHRPWVNEWATCRAVDADGEEFEYSNNCVGMLGNRYESYAPGRIDFARCHDMIGKDWTMSKQERK